jgi:hypothetical protein
MVQPSGCTVWLHPRRARRKSAASDNWLAGTTLALPLHMTQPRKRNAALRAWLSDESGEVMFGYVVVTAFALALAAAIVQLAIPIGSANRYAEKLLADNNP